MQSEQRNDDILWAAFGETGSEVQRRAVVAAFALIVVADGEVSPLELAAFRTRVGESAVFASVPAELLWHDFDDLVKRLLENQPGALSGAEDRLRLANDADSRLIVIAAARAAVVADGTDADREEVLMGHIARLIGSEPATT